jgi:hypothetical protein
VDHASSSKRDEIKTDVSEVLEVAPTVTIVSQGRTLIIDTDADRAIACGKRLGKQGMACTLLVTKNASALASSCRSHQLEFLEVNDVSVTGAFGGFSATINNEGKQRQLHNYLAAKRPRLILFSIFNPCLLTGCIRCPWAIIRQDRTPKVSRR